MDKYEMEAIFILIVVVILFLYITEPMGQYFEDYFP